MNPPMEETLKDLDDLDRSLIDRCLETAIHLLKNDLIDLRTNQ